MSGLKIYALTVLCATLLSAQAVTVDTWAGQRGGWGYFDGDSTSARFNMPNDIAVDAAGSVYVADGRNHTIRKITATGEVSTLAGFAESSGSSNGSGSTARFASPTGIVVDATGNLFVTDSSNHAIRRVSPTGVVTTFAGYLGVSGSNDGTGTSARFSYPSGIAIDSSGNLFVCDSGHTIRKITAAGVVTTLAGLAGVSGSVDGTGSSARFDSPDGVAVDGSGNLYVGDTGNRIIRKITPASVVSTLAGTAGVQGSADGTGAAASFGWPRRLCIDSTGDLLVADSQSHSIRKVTVAGVVTTFAGASGSGGSANGVGSAARFNDPRSVAIDASGVFYVADSGSDTIRKMTAAAVVSTLAGVAVPIGSANGIGSAAQFNGPFDVALDSTGNVFVADRANSIIRKITPAGIVSTFAGSAGVSGTADGTGSAARFDRPGGIAVDSSDNIYVSDSGNNSIRKITPAGVVTTFAGSTFGAAGSTNGTGTAARFDGPYGLDVDGADNIYVAELGNYTVRKITPAAVVTTLAGLAGVSGSTDGTGSAARFFIIWGLAVDSSGNVFVSEEFDCTIRKITPGGVVTTFAGQSGTIGNANGTGLSAQFYFPTGLDFDSSDNLYVADMGNWVIRKITPGAVVSTYLGKMGEPGSRDGPALSASFYSAFGVAVDNAGTVYVADTNNNLIRRTRPSLVDYAVIDQSSGVIGNGRQLGTSGSTATNWAWSLIRRPAGSTATLSSTTIGTPTFTPDVAGLYSWQLRASSASGLSITEVSLMATASSPPVAPSVSMSTTLAYVASSGAVYLGATAVVTDSDSSDFNGGNLIVVNTSLSEDQLEVLSSGRIRVVGSSVEYDASSVFSGSEVAIGTIASNGANGSNLVINFNANSTPASAQELLRHIQYQNTLASPNTSSRYLSVTVTDNTSLSSPTINILLSITIAGTGGGSGGGGTGSLAGVGGGSGCTTIDTNHRFHLSVLVILSIWWIRRRSVGRKNLEQ